MALRVPVDVACAPVSRYPDLILAVLSFLAQIAHFTSADMMDSSNCETDWVWQKRVPCRSAAVCGALYYAHRTTRFFPRVSCAGQGQHRYSPVQRASRQP